MLGKAPGGQIERHQDFIPHNSSASFTGKIASSSPGVWGEKILIAAHIVPKKRPTGQTKQKTGNLNKQADISTPIRTA